MGSLLAASDRRRSPTESRPDPLYEGATGPGESPQYVLEKTFFRSNLTTSRGFYVIFVARTLWRKTERVF